MASTVPAAKDAVIALLQAHTFPVAQPDIRWGAPTESEDDPYGGEVIYLADVTSPAGAFTVLGGQRLDETYSLRVVIDVRQYGDNERAGEIRAWQLRDEIVSVLRRDPTLNGTVNRITGFRYPGGNVPQPQAWRSQIVLEVAVVGFEFL